MNAYHPTALRTYPACLLLKDKGIHSNGADHLEVFDHAHPVICSIPLIQLFHTRTGEFDTVIAQPELGFCQSFTMADLAFKAMSGLAQVTSVAARALFVFPKMSDADAAIHPAWGNEKGIQSRFAVHRNSSCRSHL
jgi:hypothetical protein